MPRNKLAFLFVFLFLITFSVPAFAQLSVDLNVTYPSPLGNDITDLDGLACTNATGTFYCYVLTDDDSNNIIIDRFDENWENKATCDTGQLGINWNSAGFGVLNESFVISRERAYGSSTQQYAVINITDMGSCTWDSYYYNGTSAGVTTYPQRHCGYYDVNGDGSSGWLYCGMSDGIRNGTDYNDTIGVPFWDTGSIWKLALPDQTDNLTIYGTYEDLVYYYYNGSYNTTMEELSVAYGIDLDVLLWDLWKIDDATTYIYFGYFPTGGTHRLYRGNFSEFVALSGGSSLIPVYPIGNETISDQTPEFHAIAYTALNGTVMWYVDGLFNANTTITTDGTSVDAYYTYPETMSLGSHNWSATFFDDLGYNWTTGPQYFIVSGSSFYTGEEGIDATKQWLNEGMGSSFGADIISLIVAGVCAILVFINVKKDDKGAELLFGTFLLVASVFSFVGLLTVWFLVLEVTIIGVIIFWKAKGG